MTIIIGRVAYRCLPVFGFFQLERVQGGGKQATIKFANEGCALLLARLDFIVLPVFMHSLSQVY